MTTEHGIRANDMTTEDELQQQTPPTGNGVGEPGERDIDTHGATGDTHGATGDTHEATGDTHGATGDTHEATGDTHEATGDTGRMRGA
ncbi:MAG: hypothetical protein QOK26_2601, partial [Pseudonocardiales bacterium]|nr:hypothetical protein [Pseudonocardiales bacterium]